MQPTRALILAALILGFSAGSGRAAPPEPPAERRLGLEGAALASGEDWTAPDGTRFQVAGRYGIWGLRYRAPFAGAIEARYQGSWATVARSDAEAPLGRLGSRLDLGWLRGWSHLLGLGQDYRIEAGLGLLVDHQMHMVSAPPSGRARDYLDEAQLRVGPTARLDLTWFHPQDEAWRAQLHVLAAPHMIGYSTGEVAFPRQWAAFEAALGPSWRSGDWELSAAIEGRVWQGGSFSQRAGGARLGASRRF